ncbi:MAG TPA: hypothetical protein VNT23_01075, partial [Gaiellaceae bacterium]|nr:hypothetical protein [Gaiellaceae bacterium]
MLERARAEGREQRVDLALECGQVLAHGVPQPIVTGGARRDMGRRTHLPARGGPQFSAVLVLATLLAILVAPAPATAAQPALAQRLDRALAEPGLSPARTGALAVDLRTGEVVYS